MIIDEKPTITAQAYMRRFCATLEKVDKLQKDMYFCSIELVYELINFMWEKCI